MKTKKHIRISATFMIILTLVLFAKVEMEYNPRVRLLLSVISFSEHTLADENYLAYGIDLMDFFRNYTNSDVSYSGKAYIKRVEGFPYSINGSIKGRRSPDNKQFSCESNMTVLVLNVGEINLYADTSTLYMIAPSLGDFSFGFDTGVDLFKKGPDFSRDMNKEWFHENKTNIYNFIQSIDVVDTKQTFTDESGIISDKYDITIPAGEGDFIWELLGMEAPDHDIKYSLYLDKHNQIKKIVFDLTSAEEGSTLTISGDNCSTLEMYVVLPDNESATYTIKRNGNMRYTNAFDNNIKYLAANGDTYTMDFTLLLELTDDRMSVEAQNITARENDKTVLEGYCKGKIVKEQNMKPVMADCEYDLNQIEVIDWPTIRNDTDAFINDLIEDAKSSMKVLDF